MGFSTTYWGSIAVSPALNRAEWDYLTKRGYVTPMFAGQLREPRSLWPIREGELGLWCEWVPTADGTALHWNGREKFNYGTECMAYLIDNFLCPDATAARTGDPQFAGFTFDHRCSGSIFSFAEPESGVYIVQRLDVVDNAVSEYYYDVPDLDRDGDIWAEFEKGSLDELALDIEYAFTMAMQGTESGLRLLAVTLDRYTELGQQPLVTGLRAFGGDLAHVHPEPAKLLAALGLPPAT